MYSMWQSRTGILQTPWHAFPAMRVLLRVFLRVQVRHNRPAHSAHYSFGGTSQFGIQVSRQTNLARPKANRQVCAMPAHTRFPSRWCCSAAYVLVPWSRRMPAANLHTHSRMSRGDTASSVATESLGLSLVPPRWLTSCASTMCLPMSGSSPKAWLVRTPTREIVLLAHGIESAPGPLFRLRRSVWL